MDEVLPEAAKAKVVMRSAMNVRLWMSLDEQSQHVYENLQFGGLKYLRIICFRPKCLRKGCNVTTFSQTFSYLCGVVRQITQYEIS